MKIRVSKRKELRTRFWSSYSDLTGMERMNRFEEEFMEKTRDFESSNGKLLESFNNFENELESFLAEQKGYTFHLEQKQVEEVSTEHFSTKAETLKRRYKSLIQEKDDSKKELWDKINELRESQKKVNIMQDERTSLELSIEMKRLEIELTKDKENSVGSEVEDISILTSEIEKLNNQKSEYQKLIETKNSEITKNEDKLKDIEEGNQKKESKVEIYYEELKKSYVKSLEKVKKQVNDCEKSLKERNGQIEELDRYYGDMKEEIESSQELIDDNKDDIFRSRTSIAKNIENLKKIRIDQADTFKSKVDEETEKKIQKIKTLESTTKKILNDIIEVVNVNKEKYENFNYDVEIKINEFDSIKKRLRQLDLNIRNQLELYAATNLLDVSIESRSNELREYLKKNGDLVKKTQKHVSSYLKPLNEFLEDGKKHASTLKSEKLDEMKKNEAELREVTKFVKEEISKGQKGAEASESFSQDRVRHFEEEMKIMKVINELQEQCLQDSGSSNEDYGEILDTQERMKKNRRSRKKKEFIKKLILEVQKKVNEIYHHQTSKLEEIERIISTGGDDKEGDDEQEQIDQQVNILQKEVREAEQKLKSVKDKERIILRKIAQRRSYEKKQKNEGESHVQTLESEIQKESKQAEEIEEKINHEEQMQEDEDELDYERELVVEKEVDLFTIEAQIEEKSFPKIEIPQKLRPKIVIQENVNGGSQRCESPQITLVVPSPSANRKRAGLMSPAPTRSGKDIFKI